MAHTIALFGEAEKGEFHKGYYCDTLSELSDYFGNPPPESAGLYYATQAVLYHYPLIFFRVREEGFSVRDYIDGIEILSSSPVIKNISAFCAPGVGDHQILQALLPLCTLYHQILITSEKDLFDYLSDR